DVLLEDLAVEHDLLDLEGNVLVRLVADRALEVLARDLEHRDVPHDHGPSGDRCDDALGLEAALPEDLLDGELDLVGRVHLARRVAGDRVAVTALRELDRLDLARPYVEPENAVLLAEHFRASG